MRGIQSFSLSVEVQARVAQAAADPGAVLHLQWDHTQRSEPHRLRDRALPSMKNISSVVETLLNIGLDVIAERVRNGAGSEAGETGKHGTTKAGRTSTRGNASQDRAKLSGRQRRQAARV